MTRVPKLIVDFVITILIIVKLRGVLQHQIVRHSCKLCSRYCSLVVIIFLKCMPATHSNIFTVINYDKTVLLMRSSMAEIIIHWFEMRLRPMVLNACPASAYECKLSLQGAKYACLQFTCVWRKWPFFSAEVFSN